MNPWPVNKSGQIGATSLIHAYSMALCHYALVLWECIELCLNKVQSRKKLCLELCILKLAQLSAAQCPMLCHQRPNFVT